MNYNRLKQLGLGFIKKLLLKMMPNAKFNIKIVIFALQSFHLLVDCKSTPGFEEKADTFSVFDANKEKWMIFPSKSSVCGMACQ